jgi:hypothetical protein
MKHRRLLLSCPLPLTRVLAVLHHPFTAKPVAALAPALVGLLNRFVQRLVL